MGPGMRHPLPGKERVADVCPDALGICRDVSYSRKKAATDGMAALHVFRNSLCDFVYSRS